MKCKWCGAEIGKKEKVCPNCGKKIKRTGKTIVKIFLLLIAISVIFRVATNILETLAYSKMTPEEKIAYDEKKKIEAEEAAKKKAEEDLKYIYETDNSSYAYYLIKEYVKEHLKAPKTAEFPGDREVSIVKRNDTYIISGYVDSSNSFGAMLRSKYIAAIRQTARELDKNSWVIEYCNFD